MPDGAALYAAARLLWQQQDERNDAVRRALLQLIAILPEPLNMHLETMVKDAFHRPLAKRDGHIQSTQRGMAWWAYR